MRAREPGGYFSKRVRMKDRDKRTRRAAGLCGISTLAGFLEKTTPEGEGKV
jgi:hypothetical protein